MERVLTQNSDKKTNEDLIGIFLTYSSKTGKTPTTRDYREMGISLNQVRKAYGSHNNAVIAAGLVPNKKPPHDDTQNDSMIDGFIEGSWDKKAPLNTSDINHDPKLYSSSVYNIIFGGMNGVRVAAGFEPSPVDRTRYQKEEVQSRLQEVMAKVGRPLTAKEINAHPDLPSVTTVLKSYGTTSLFDVWRMVGIS